MRTGKIIYDKITKFIKLSAIWVIRILFASNNFKISIFKKVYYAINGGYIADQVALYNLNSKNKKQYLSEFDWYKSRYINEPYNFILNDKLVCSDLLKQYIKVPEVIIIKKKGVCYFQKKEVSNYDDFINYLKNNNEVYIKPINIGKGIGVNKISYKSNYFYIDYKEVSKKELIKFLNSRDNWFISSCVKQSKELDKIYDKTTNTIRLITVRNGKTKKCEVLYAVQRIGTKETIPVDNGSRGGLVAKINLNDGTLSSAKSIKKMLIMTRILIQEVILKVLRSKILKKLR